MANITRQEFLSYIQAFNTQDYELQHSFYHPDVVLTLPDPEIPPLRGSGAIMEHYRGVHEAANEFVVPQVVMVDESRIFFVMEVFFEYTKATDKAVHNQSVEKGDVFKVKVWTLYGMENRKMKSIECSLNQERMLGKVDVKACVKESKLRADANLFVSSSTVL